MKLLVACLSLCVTFFGTVQSVTQESDSVYAGVGTFKHTDSKTSLSALVSGGFGFQPEVSTGGYDKLVEIGSAFNRPQANLLVVVAANVIPVQSENDIWVVPSNGELALHDFIHGFSRIYRDAKVIVTSAQNSFLDFATAGQLKPTTLSRHDVAKAGFQVFTTEQKFPSEFDVVEEVIKSVPQEPNRSHPDLYVVLVEAHEVNDELSTKIESLRSSLNRKYERVAQATIVVPKSSMKEGFRRLQSAKLTGFEGADKLLMVITAITVIFMLIGLFCCVPWSSELDPLLVSGIKTDNGYKMD